MNTRSLASKESQRCVSHVKLGISMLVVKIFQLTSRLEGRLREKSRAGLLPLCAIHMFCTFTFDRGLRFWNGLLELKFTAAVGVLTWASFILFFEQMAVLNKLVLTIFILTVLAVLEEELEREWM